MNNDNEEAVFIMRYNDNIQSENIRINEDTQSIFLAILKENLYSIIANNILPPSKSDIGNRFNIPRKREDKTNSSPNKLFIGGRSIEIITHKRFTAGPAAQMNISVEKEPIVVLGIRAAPKGVNRISRKLTPDMRAAKICPSSCRNAARKQDKASRECVKISAIAKTTAKKPIRIFIKSLSYIKYCLEII